VRIAVSDEPSGARRWAAAAATARVEFLRLAPRLSLMVVALGAVHWARSGPGDQGARLATLWLEPDENALGSVARSHVWTLGSALVATLWTVALARAHRLAAGDERALWCRVGGPPIVRGLGRLGGRLLAAAALCIPIALAAEVAADRAPARPVLAEIEHPGLALLGVDRARSLELPALRRGRLRVELVTLAGTGTGAPVTLELERIDGGARSVSSFELSGRREVELELPEGRGTLSLSITRSVDGAALWVPSGSMVWVGAPLDGARASAALALRLLSALTLAAALWPLLARVLDPGLTAAALATAWLWAWLGGPHAAWWPGGALPAALERMGAGLLAPLDGVRAGALAALVVAALALEAKIARSDGEAAR
jgi:hypothetical protein